MGHPRQLKKGDKTRAFVVTQWNIDCDYQALLDKGQVRFIAYGLEVCPTTGKEHHQAWVYFWNPRGITNRVKNAIGNMFGPIHCRVEPMRGKFQENDAYCGKENTLTKLGDEPEQGARGDLDETKDMIMRGDITVDQVAQEDPHMYHMYERTLSKIEEIALRHRFRTEMTQGVWIHGPSGAGKSHMAFEGFNPDTHYVKCLDDEWWDGYIGQEVVIINEFRGQIRLSELFDLVDKWPKTVKQRCRAPVPFLAKKLIITSVKGPREVYSRLGDDNEPWAQFERRFKIIELEQKYSEGNIRPLSQKRKACEIN